MSIADSRGLSPSSRGRTNRPLLPEEPPTKRRWVAPDDSSGWRTFTHQQAALDAAAADDSIWAKEQNKNGKRSYIVASRDDFWRRYRTLPSDFRHYYELIRHGSPCHLYLDVEYCRRANPTADGARMIRTLLAELRAALASLLEIDAAATDDWLRVVDLDSSTPTKFSRHLILRLHNGMTAFSDNLHCGRFVHTVCANLLRRSHAEPEIAALFVKPPLPKEEAEGTADGGGASSADRRR